MKTHHILLIIAAALIGWYCISKKKQVNNPANTNKKKKYNLPEDAIQHQKRDYITTKEALQIAEQYPDHFCLKEVFGSNSDHKYSIEYANENGIFCKEYISEDTFLTLIEKGYTALYI